MPRAETTESTTAFWRWLSQRQGELSTLVDPAQPFWDEVLGRLRRIDPGLGFELSGLEPRPREFVVTAEGRPTLFSLVERVVAQAPSLPGWTFIPLKQAQGFGFSTRFEELRLDARRLWFLPLTHREAPAAVGLRVGVPGMDPAQEHQVVAAVWLVLDAGLGERDAAAISHLEVRPLPRDPEAEGFIELGELPRFLAYHRRKHPRS
jgi:hypothetical protein